MISCYQKLELQWNFVESIGFIGILFKILCIFNSEWLNLKSDKLHMKHWIRIITVWKKGMDKVWNFFFKPYYEFDK